MSAPRTQVAMLAMTTVALLACAPLDTKPTARTGLRATGRAVEAGQTREAETTTPFVLSWPFRMDEPGVEIYQTFGQAQGLSSFSIHEGLDIYASPGTRVFAPISGTIVAMFTEGMKPWTNGFAIRSFVDGKEFITKLLHFEPSTMQFALGDPVQQGDLLGEIAAWPEDSEFLPHLHIGVGDGQLVVKGNGPGAGNAALLFAYKANPLKFLERERDGIPPQLVAAGAETPFTIRPVEQDSGGNWKRSDTVADPNSLSGPIDIELSVRDFVPPGTSFALAPQQVRLTVESLEDSEFTEKRQTVFAGKLSTANRFPYSAYVEGPKEHGPDAYFVYHYMSMRPVDESRDASLEPKPLDTDALRPGRYRITAHAADLDNDVRLGEMTVRIVGARSR